MNNFFLFLLFVSTFALANLEERSIMHGSTDFSSDSVYSNGLDEVRNILLEREGFSKSEFALSPDSIMRMIKDGNDSLNGLMEMHSMFFDGIPNFDSTKVAFSQIVSDFPNMDTLFLAKNYKKMREMYEQIVRLRMLNFVKSPVKRVSLKKNAVSDAWDKIVGGVKKFSELTSAEKELLLKYPMRALGSARAYELAEDWSKEYQVKLGKRYGVDTSEISRGETILDAFRHTAYSMLLCRETGTQFDNVSECLKWSRRFAEAHETEDNLSSKVDYHNNTIAREEYEQYLKVSCEIEIGTCVNEEVVGLSRDETKALVKKIADKGVGLNDENLFNQMPWMDNVVFLKSNIKKKFDGKETFGEYFCKDGQKPSKNDCAEFPDYSAIPKRIGVLKKESKTKCKEEISITLDTEDDDNITGVVSGDDEPYGVSFARPGVKFTYCVLEIDGSMPRVPYDYVVLRLDNACPKGSYAFRRYHDTEDDNTKNSYSGNIWPNIADRNVVLEYCFVPSKSTSKMDFPFDYKYGIFAKSSFSGLIQSEVKIDDEDDDNNNSWEWYDTSSDYQKRIQKIINGSGNTLYHVARWVEIVLNKINLIFMG